MDVELPRKKKQLANVTPQGLSLVRGKNIIPEAASLFIDIFESRIKNSHNVLSGLSNRDKICITVIHYKHIKFWVWE